jgi:hypothetical protein
MRWKKNDFAEEDAPGGQKLRCVCADEELAVFAHVWWDTAEQAWITGFNTLRAYNNDKSLQLEDCLYPIERVFRVSGKGEESA